MKNKPQKHKKRNSRKKKKGISLIKKMILTLFVLFLLFLIIPTFVPADAVPEQISELTVDEDILQLHLFEDAVDGINGILEHLQELLDTIFNGIKAAEQTLFPDNNTEAIQLEEIPEYSGEPYTVLNNNIPYFTKEELTEESFEFYSELDSFGRCGVTMACIGKDIMPTEERGAIGMIKPTGWKLKKYDIVDGKYIYNRCHLIGYQLTGENANEKNLITGTRYLNVEGMLPFENEVADYIKKTGNHVMYRVTPIFDGNNLVASGVQMEAYSVEDNGEGICYHVYVYNVQPGIEIDYATGENWLAE